jgi:hypothetical protein
MFGRVLGGKEHRKMKMPVGPRSRAKSYDSRPMRQGNCETERRNVRVLSRRLPIPNRYLPGAGPGFLNDVRLPANQVDSFATVLFVLGMQDRPAELADASHDRTGLDLEAESLPKRIDCLRKKRAATGARQ